VVDYDGPVPDLLVPPMMCVPELFADEQAAPPAPPAADAKLAKLLAKYQKACESGDTAKARKLAAKCLEIDPTCFGK
jgi:hypothetical protein